MSTPEGLKTLPMIKDGLASLDKISLLPSLWDQS